MAYDLRLLWLRSVHYVLRNAATLDDRICDRLRERLNRNSENIEIPCNIDNKLDPIFERINLITHAGGGLSGLNYLNCKEAYYSYLEKGNRVFEYDVMQDAHGRYVLAHIGDGKSLIDERFHPMQFDECINIIQDTPEITVIFDCKFKSLTEFCMELAGNLSVESMDRVVIQVFNEQNILEAKNAGFIHMLFVCVMDTDYLWAMKLCKQYGIGAVSISEKAVSERKGWNVFFRCGIKAYVYTVNRIEEFKRLYEKGFAGVFSDFLNQHDVKITIDTMNSSKL